MKWIFKTLEFEGIKKWVEIDPVYENAKPYSPVGEIGNK